MWLRKGYDFTIYHKKSLSNWKGFSEVVMDGIEPPTQGFSVLKKLVSYGSI